jgi:hypothetical protein
MSTHQDSKMTAAGPENATTSQVCYRSTIRTRAQATSLSNILTSMSQPRTMVRSLLLLLKTAPPPPRSLRPTATPMIPSAIQTPSRSGTISTPTHHLAPLITWTCIRTSIATRIWRICSESSSRACSRISKTATTNPQRPPRPNYFCGAICLFSIALTRTL